MRISHTHKIISLVKVKHSENLNFFFQNNGIFRIIQKYFATEQDLYFIHRIARYPHICSVHLDTGRFLSWVRPCPGDQGKVATTSSGFLEDKYRWSGG
jgi:hypothetical protein